MTVDAPRTERAQVRSDAVQIAATDGYPLSATLCAPAGKAPVAAVIINPATGVPKEYYAPFARFLAEHGYLAVAYDYRGMGASLTGTMKTFRGRMSEWGEKDFTGVIDAISAQFPGIPLLCVGHSVGGQLVGLAANNHKLDAVLSVAGQVGYWRLWQGKDKLKSWLNFFVLIPLLTRIFGYYPGSKVGAGDLPSGIARQWARWCRNRHFIVDDKGRPLREHFDAYRGRMLFYSFFDDGLFAPRAAVEALRKYYRHAHTEHRHFDDQSTGGRAVGHFGFFRPTFRRTLWRDALEWLKHSHPTVADT